MVEGENYKLKDLRDDKTYYVSRHGSNVAMVQNIDYAPTFLEMAGAVIPEDIQGQSLVPLLKDNRTKVRGNANKGWRDAIYYHYYEYPAEHMVKRH